MAYKRPLPADPAVWERAEKMVDNWYARREEMIARGVDAVAPIGEHPEEFDTPVHCLLAATDEYIASRTVGSLRGFSPEAAPVLDEFGGFMIQEMRQEGTGYFRTQKVGGRWWLIDPLGYPFYLVGVSGMGTSYQRSEYERACAVEKHGSVEAWAKDATRELADEYGFNTRTVLPPSMCLPAPDEDALLRGVARPLNYQHKFGFVSAYETARGNRDTSKLSGSTLLVDGMHVFDPEFETFCDEEAARVIEKLGYGDDPHFIGYATDNEIPNDLKMLDQFLRLDVENKTSNDHSYAAAWAFLARATGKEEPTLADVDDSLRDEFRGMVYERYFSIAAPAVRRHDPHRLVLGCRALNNIRTSPWYMRAAGYHCDVITLNWYKDWTPRLSVLNNIAKWTDTPICITEFFAKSDECEGTLANAVNTTAPNVRTQGDRGIFYQNYVLRLLEARNCVGWFWFQFIDHDPTVGSYGGKRSANVGFYTASHKTYPDFAARVAEVNRNIPALIQFFDERDGAK